MRSADRRAAGGHREEEGGGGVNQTFTAYAVKLEAGPMLASKVKRAREYRDELRKAGCGKGKIVKVEVTVRPCDPNVKTIKA